MPYFYLYDSFLQDSSYTNQLIKLESVLTDLGINGKIGRLTLLKSARDLIESALRDGADTVVAVGNDITVSRVIEILAKHKKITLGLIPLGQNDQTIASLLGIPIGMLACHVLSSRIVEHISLGKVNNTFFIKSVVLDGSPILECENRGRRFRIELQNPHNIKVCNLDSWGARPEEVANPQNNTLEAVVVPHNTKRWFIRPPTIVPSIIAAENFYFNSNNKDETTLLIDGHKIIKTPATLSVANEVLRVIVGKKRVF